MNIIFEIEGKRYSVAATELLPVAPVKETVQERAAAAKAVAAAGPAGPGPEKAEIPAEPASAASAPAAAALKATPTGRKRGQTVTNPATAQAPQAAASAPVAAPTAAPEALAASAAAPSVAAATKGDMPAPAQLDEYRAKFMILVKQLTDAGAVKKGDVAVATQLRNIMLKFNKATDVAVLTNTQWTAFFDRVNTQYVNGEAGIQGLVAKL